MTNYKAKYLKYKIKYTNFRSDGGNDNKNNELTLGIKDPWLFYIQTGEKKVEGRMGDSNKYQSWIGKTVKFMNRTRMFPVKVIAVRHYSTLYEFLDREGFNKVLPGIKSYTDAVSLYHQFYNDELIKNKGGMVAIEVSLI